MKRNKWQRLAAIGLCSSLLVNAFSGVTAVAETVTIESSPTAESSTKEETPASSVKEETTKASTENSQVTTDTSQEEVEQTEKTEIIQEENILEPSSVQAKIMPRAFVWAATGTTNKTTVRLNDVVDYRLKFENITTDDTNSDIVGPIRIESKLAAGMTRPTSVIIKVGPEEQNVVLGEGSHNANSGGEYFVWTESTRTVTAFINRLHGRTSGNTGYIKTLYFQTRITSGIHNEKKYIDSTIRFNGFGAVNRRNEMTYVDKFAGNLGLKGSLKFYDEDGQSSKEQMSLSMNPVLFKSTNSKVEGTLLRYPLTMTNAGNGLYSFNTGLKTVGTSNGGSWLFFSNDIAINFATATTNRIDKIVLTPPKTTFPDSRTGVMTSRAYTSTTYTRSNYDISAYNFTKATGKTWRITNLNPHSGVSTNIMFSDNLVGTTGQFNAGNNSATITYYIYYKKLYENFVNSSGQKIAPPLGFTQGKKTVINSEAYTFKQAGTLPDTYTTGGKTYKFKGWYKGKTKTEPLKTTKAPSYGVTYDDNDDLNVVYEEEIPTASVTLTRPKEVIDTNTNVIWTTTITNTSKAPLQNLNLKKGPNWSAGLTIPTFMEVTPEGETTKSIPVNSTLWTEGVSLPNAVPIGKKVSIAFTTRATGKPNTVLKAEVVVFGGIKDSTVDNFVRIRPNDQEVVTPTTEGFISVPTFDFGQVGVAGSKQQHNLKKAADYYGNGTRNPYVRIKKTQPNWSLTAQLSQPKSATDSLPTATRLLLGAAPVSSFTNYNQPTELKNAVGTTSAISLTANNTATSIIANKQFTGSNVYQLDFTFNNVKLEVPANQGVKGQQYKAAVTWNLVTGP
ncbi:WxL domain-containing protein [Enterococcus faecalis]|uniref:WxL domain-containing protein n=1 Tax=Enterococcus faecalis TaxID=1351 RepID=UPI000DE9CF7C|nr:WxL domain-containing protein [Enterococcus faecalis]EGO2629839.1 WxL domain-containing protein [Enterococcus faecalis]EGO2651354.1 WxL domain-containing protein [Enterococcus faecalis]EGO5161493.1 WxL domain-containing protein [Enterococcus faecalis]EGO5175696.1 WxL domain-containing protein [Enterococcus faecalis]EGO6002455.1 WxL domain-containing protein [Enterococcus faecalis]